MKWELERNETAHTSIHWLMRSKNWIDFHKILIIWHTEMKLHMHEYNCTWMIHHNPGKIKFSKFNLKIKKISFKITPMSYPSLSHLPIRRNSEKIDRYTFIMEFWRRFQIFSQKKRSSLELSIWAFQADRDCAKRSESEFATVDISAEVVEAKNLSS